MYTIVLDVGHGGRDPGAVGNTTYEKNNNLTLALAVGKILSQYAEIKVEYTRTTDKDFCPSGFDVALDLQKRIEVAKQYKPDVFVSLHNNSFNKQAKGIETHCFKLGGTDEKIAKAIQNQLSALPFINRGIKVTNLYVTRAFDKTNTSACLVEYGFIDSEEASILANMNQASSAISKGILDFLGIKTKPRSESVVKVGVLLYTKDDSITGFRVAEKFGNCAVFVRKGDGSASPDVMNCEKLYILGGGTVGHPNEEILSGDTWWQTIVNTKNKLGF